MQYFFVTGCPKSGTTWLQMLLDAHPEVVCSGEGAFFERLFKPVAEVRASYNDYMTYANKAVYEGNGFYGQMPFQDIQEPLRQIAIKFMTQRAVAGTLAAGDKTPRHNLYLNSMLNFFPEARFINIVRHPYDVAVSKLFHAARVGRAQALDTGSEIQAKMVEEAGKSWTTAQQRVLEFKTKHPDLLVEVKYEDLIEQPLREAARLFRHLGVCDKDETAQAAVDLSAFEKLSGGRSQGVADVKSFFRKGVAGDWKNVLTPEMARLMNRHCEPLMLEYGYEVLA